MGSGVAINLVLAFLLFAFAFMGYGVQTATTTVDTVSECVIAVTQANRDQTAARVHLRGPGRTGEGGRLRGRRPGHLLQRHPRDRAGRRCSARSGPTAPRPPPWSSSATAARSPCSPSTVVSPRLDPDNPERITKVGFLGVAPTTERERQGPGFVVDHDGRRDLADPADDRLDAGEGLPRGPGRPRARGARPQRPDERRRRRAGGRRGGLPGQGRRTATGSSR